MLGRYINPTYLTPEAMKEVSGLFERDSSVQLRSFLLPEIAGAIKDLAKRIDEKEGLGRGMSASGKYEVGAEKVRTCKSRRTST